MTRLAFDLGGLERPAVRRRPRSSRRSRSPPRRDTFASARLWDPRPLQDDASTSSRRCASTTTSPTSTRTATRSTTPSARSCSPAASWPSSRTRAPPAGSTSGSSTPTASASPWCPVNEVASEGQPTLLIGNLPPVSIAGRPDDHPAADLLRRAADARTSSPAPSRTSSTTRPARATRAARSGPRRAGRGRPGSRSTRPSCGCCSRPGSGPRPAHQRPGHERQPAAVPSHRWPTGWQLVAPFLRFDKDPYLVIDDSGRLVYIQDAYTTSDRFPDAQAFDPTALTGTGLGGDAFNYIRNSVKITMDAYDGTMHFYVADPDDPIIRAYEGVFPTLFEPLTAMPADLRAHLRVPEELFNVQTRIFGRYHVTDPPAVLPQGRPVDRADRHVERADPAVRGVLRRDAPAGRDRGSSSCSSSRWSRPAART